MDLVPKSYRLEAQGTGHSPHAFPDGLSYSVQYIN